MNLKNKALISFPMILSILVISILIFCFWPLPDSVTNADENLKTAVKEANKITAAKTNQPSTNTTPNTTTSVDNSDAYQAAADGTIGLKDKAIEFYNRAGRLPTTPDLLNAPLDDQTTTSLKDSNYLNDHNLGIIGIFPSDSAGSRCSAGIKTEGIYDANGIRVIYDVYAFNPDGAWKFVCIYKVQGTDPASVQVDGCLNADFDQATFEQKAEEMHQLCIRP